MTRPLPGRTLAQQKRKSTLRVSILFCRAHSGKPHTHTSPHVLRPRYCYNRLPATCYLHRGSICLAHLICPPIQRLNGFLATSRSSSHPIVEPARNSHLAPSSRLSSRTTAPSVAMTELPCEFHPAVDCPYPQCHHHGADLDSIDKMRSTQRRL